MAQALAEAEKGRRTTAPNPTVGALLVRDGRIVAKGHHEKKGGPHAEAACLADAAAKGESPAGATMYVTLEPCNHFGATPPCSLALIKAGVGRVVVGCRDENPVAAGGIERLQAAGVQVEWGVLETACRDAIADFRTWNALPRPHLTLKLAQSVDGRLAARTGHSRFVTGPKAREHVQELRAQSQAVLIGAATLVADNPRLDARTGDHPAQPLAVIVTTRLPGEPEAFRLLNERPHQAIFATTQAQADGPSAVRLRELGIRVWGLEAAEHGGLSLSELLARLRAETAVYRVLCEGGGRLAGKLFAEDLVDRLIAFVAPKVLGDEHAVPSVTGLAPDTMDQAIPLRLADVSLTAPDVMLTYLRA